MILLLAWAACAEVALIAWLGIELWRHQVNMAVAAGLALVLWWGVLGAGWYFAFRPKLSAGQRRYRLYRLDDFVSRGVEGAGAESDLPRVRLWGVGGVQPQGPQGGDDDILFRPPDA